ncbi:hypothetical protein D9611_012589 [Ephemerocybe angulata]|uniref:Carbonic anhydrase n=1 Tax=Ephemerocybe angulata TaxID=980116 RepID=A0A8H5ET01_9AGAR|nr:hypothetical protein D9611_012589 [Tulosesus angulatus]
MPQDSPGLLEGMALRGQHAPFMIVDYSDSRVPGILRIYMRRGMLVLGTLKFKHVVIMGHYGCSGVAASMALLPEGYAEHWLGITPFPLFPRPHFFPSPLFLFLFLFFDIFLDVVLLREERPEAPEETPADLAVQRWILSIHKIYETSGRPEIREHRERVQRLLSSPSPSSSVPTSTSTSTSTGISTGTSTSTPTFTPEWTWGRVEQIMMGGGDDAGVREVERESRVGEVKLHERAFRALVEENVKANVWRLGRSRVIRELPTLHPFRSAMEFPPLWMRFGGSLSSFCGLSHHEAYTKALHTDEPLNPVYVHGWVYDLETGVVSDLGVSAGPPGWVPPPGAVQGFPAMRGA